MRTDDPRPFIEALQRSGMANAVIRARLLLDGWTEDVLDPLFAELAPAVVAQVDAREQAQKAHARYSLAGAVVAVVIAAAGLGALGGFSIRPPATYAISLPSPDGATTTMPSLSYGALPALADPAYFADVKHSLVAARASFVSANLTAMQLEVYRDGQLALTVPILAKGKVGSWWETPVGIYRIETKEESHFSSFGHVYQPWSMQFQGNFFIHGWPTYEDGTPVASSYSGGCIRLSTDDAKNVYELSDVKMPVLVFKEAGGADEFTYRLKTPAISAGRYLVVDMDTATVLASKGADEQAPIASITKLVTALVATEYINLDKQITVPRSALVYTAVPRLKAGQKVRAYDLLYLVLQESSNEAAEALASVVGRAQFIFYMNAKARAIGLEGTNFTDPSGAKNDLSSPKDLFALLRYIDENRRFVLEMTAGNLKDSAYGASAFRSLENFNEVDDAPGRFLGGKIGQTNEAGETYAGIYEVQVDGKPRRVAVIVLGSTGVQRDVAALLRFVGSAYASQ